MYPILVNLCTICLSEPFFNLSEYSSNSQSNETASFLFAPLDMPNYMQADSQTNS